MDAVAASETVHLLALRGIEAVREGDFPAALREFEEAAGLAAGFPELAAQYVQALVNVAAAAGQLGDGPRAVGVLREALGICDRHPDGELAEYVPAILVSLGDVLLRAEDPDGAQAALERARHLLREAEERRPGDGDTADLLIAAHAALTSLAIRRDDLARAERLATESLERVAHRRPDLAGRPLLGLAVVNLTTGRLDLAEDFARQALAVCAANEQRVAAAEARLGLGQILLAAGRAEEAEAELTAGRDGLEEAGLPHLAASALQFLAQIALTRGDAEQAERLDARGVRLFEEAGAPLAAAEVAAHRALVAFMLGRADEADAELTRLAGVFAAHGLPLRAAQVHANQAALLEARALDDPAAGAAFLARAVDLAVPAALAIDGMRYALPGGHQRDRWLREVAAPAMRLAFRLAARSRDAALVAQLVEFACAGTPLLGEGGPAPGEPVPGVTLTLLDPPPGLPGGDALQLGAALAWAAVGAGLPVAPPPRLAWTPDGTIALAGQLALARERYGGRVRDERVVPTW